VTHVFISYVRQNRDVVDKLAKELTNRGVVVWLDRHNIDPGGRWRDAIKKAIQSGTFFIACFSKEYNERDKTYMNEELTLAIDELRERPSDKTWFIPILINEARIPSRRISNAEDLSALQATMLYEDWESGINRILRALRYDDPALARIWQLVDIVEGPFEDERVHAIRQLGAIRTTEKSALSSLIKATEANNSAIIRKASLNALGEIGSAAAEVVPALATTLNDPDETVRRYAADALGKVGPAAAVAVPPLAVVALKDPDEDVRFRAIDALGQISPAAPEALPALAATLKHPDTRIRLAAVIRLSQIGADAVPTLVTALQDPDKDVRWNAVDSLGKIGPAAAEALQALTAAPKDPDGEVRKWAALVALRKIGASAVPTLVTALQDLTKMSGGTLPTL
jgi:HEAT repeat protein